MMQVPRSFLVTGIVTTLMWLYRSSELEPRAHCPEDVSARRIILGNEGPGRGEGLAVGVGVLGVSRERHPGEGTLVAGEDVDRGGRAAEVIGVVADGSVEDGDEGWNHRRVTGGDRLAREEVG